MNQSIGLLYSYKRCPYAIRARVMLNLSDLVFDLHEVDLRDKPDSLLNISPKGTVPVLQLQNGKVIDESIDIVRYAERTSLPKGWTPVKSKDEQRGQTIINLLNDVIIPATNHLRWPDKFKGKQEAAMSTLLEHIDLLTIQSGSLLGYPSVFDVIAFPTVRQLYRITPEVIQRSPELEDWLLGWIDHPAFKMAMTQFVSTTE